MRVSRARGFAATTFAAAAVNAATLVARRLHPLADEGYRISTDCRLRTERRVGSLPNKLLIV